MKKTVAFVFFACFFLVGNVYSQLNCDVDNGNEKFFKTFESDKNTCVVLCDNDTISINKIHQLGIYYLPDCDRTMIWIVYYDSGYIGQPIILINGNGSKEQGFVVDEFLLWKGENDKKSFSNPKDVRFRFEDGTFVSFGDNGSVVYSSAGMADELVKKMKY